MNPPILIRIEQTPMLHGREWGAWQRRQSGVLCSVLLFRDFNTSRLVKTRLPSGSLDTGGDPPAGWLFGFNTADENESAAYFVRELVNESRIKALGEAAEPFVIAPEKDKEAVDGIRAVYEAMTAELIKQDESLADEATFLGTCLRGGAPAQSQPVSYKNLMAQRYKVIEKEDGSTLRAFLELVNQPRVQKSEFSPVIAETVDPSSIMEEVYRHLQRHGCTRG